jgi:hypothetical protein
MWLKINNKILYSKQIWYDTYEKKKLYFVYNVNCETIKRKKFYIIMFTTFHCENCITSIDS